MSESELLLGQQVLKLSGLGKAFNRSAFWIVVVFSVLLSGAETEANSWITSANGLAHHDRLQGPIFINEPPRKLTYTNDTGLEVKCQAEGQPRPTIFWITKDGNPANDVEGIRYTRHDGTLVFRPFKSQEFSQSLHNTIYRCGATNSQGTVLSRDVIIRAVVRQNYEAQVYDSFAFPGNTAILRCLVSPSLPADFTVEAWFRDDGHVFDRKGIVEESYSFLRTGELLVYDANPPISGRRYGCKVRNHVSGENIRSTVNARVIITEPPNGSPPRMLLHKTKISVKVGSTVEMPCVAEGNPLPSYRWLRGDTHRHHSVKENYRTWLRSGVMTFRNVRIEDNGVYICIAENSEGQLRSETVLIVTDTLEPMILPPRQIIDIGKTLTLNCTVRGHPVIDITWSKDGQPLSTSSRISYTTQFVLEVRSVQREDRGMYQCMVSNEEDSAQAIAEIRINDIPPAIVSFFRSQTAAPKSPLSLSCGVAGSPTPTVTWFLDGQPVPRSGDRIRTDAIINDRGYVMAYLNISSVRVEDSGEYCCTAENHVGRVTHASRLNVIGPIFVRPLRNVTAVAGDLVHIRCPYGGFPIHSIRWFKGSEPVLMTARTSLTDEGILSIDVVDRVSDAGEYKCGVQDDAGHIAYGSTILNVLVAPLIDAHYFPETLTTEEHSRPRLICSVSKGDPPIMLRWLKNGVPLTTRQEVSVHTTEDSSIVSFRKVTAEDSGMYSCTATNVAATVNRTLHMTVNVSPSWNVLPTNTSVTVGDTLRLQCGASGYPVPAITWKKAKGATAANFSFLYSSARVQQFSNGTLLIKVTDLADGGHYLCSANNGVGSGIRAALFVKINGNSVLISKEPRRT